MTNGSLTRTAKVFVAATLCAAIVIQVYILFSGTLTVFLSNLPFVGLYLAIGSALSAAWLMVIEWFGWGVTDRQYRARMIVGDCVLSLLFAALWLLPVIAIPICIAIFAVSDWLVALIVSDALKRWRIFRKASTVSQSGTS